MITSSSCLIINCPHSCGLTSSAVVPGGGRERWQKAGGRKKPLHVFPKAKRAHSSVSEAKDLNLRGRHLCHFSFSVLRSLICSVGVTAALV